MTDPIIITAPVLPGATVQQFRDHKRIDITEEDATVLPIYIAAATEHFVWRTGITPYETEREVAMDRFPCERVICLPFAQPNFSVTHIKYMDSDGNDTTWNSASYVVDNYLGRVAPAYGQTWPTFTPYPLSAVRIRYKSGIGIGSPQTYVQSGIRQCICEMAASLYDHRESLVVTERASVAAFAENPLTKAMLSQFKRNYAF